MEEIRIACKILAVIPEGKSPLRHSVEVYFTVDAIKV
jgi:hypothetical protein